MMGRRRSPRIRQFKTTMKVGVSSAGPNQTWIDLSYDGLLVSQSNHKLPSGSWSGGGNFYKVTSRYDHGPVGPVTSWYRVGTTVYGFVRGCNNAPAGGFPSNWIAIPTNGSLPPSTFPLWSSKYSELAALYATGYKRARPGNPQASLGQFLVELRDLPRIPLKGVWGIAKSGAFRDIPSVFLRSLGAFRALGHEYLNYEFGWKPFVNDLRKVYYLWQQIDKEMARIVRENGRGVHRRARLENSETSSTKNLTSPYAYAWTSTAPPNIFMNPGSVGTWTVKRKTTSWFVGKFTYWIPDVSSSLWDARARLALFGALPTPELLWEVLPWSWLIDWFANVGDVISNVSTNAVDNLVCKYSYVMQHVQHEQRAHMYTWHEQQTKTPTNDREWDSCNHSFWSQLYWESKARVGGNNPYGLDVQLTSLSTRQLAILAALGITRGLVR